MIYRAKYLSKVSLRGYLNLDGPVNIGDANIEHVKKIFNNSKNENPILAVMIQYQNDDVMVQYTRHPGGSV